MNTIMALHTAFVKAKATFQMRILCEQRNTKILLPLRIFSTNIKQDEVHTIFYPQNSIETQLQKLEYIMGQNHSTTTSVNPTKRTTPPGAWKCCGGPKDGEFKKGSLPVRSCYFQVLSLMQS